MNESDAWQPMRPRAACTRPRENSVTMVRVGRRARPGYLLVISVVPWLLLVVSALHATWWTRSSRPSPSGDGSAAKLLADAGLRSEPAPPQRRPWSAIHNWTYWLDGPRLDEIADSSFELAVIDYSKDGSADGEFSAEQIEALRRGTCERRVLAYLSIGQAEEYRFYWQRSWTRSGPGWDAGRDPDWEGAHWVRYWDPAWQTLVYQYLDRILAQGFDGIYLDRVDAFAESYARGHERDMVDFVMAIARYARARSPLGDDFGIIVQNAAELGSRHADYVAEVTGIAQEETYVAATNRATSAPERTALEAELNLFREASRGHLVLTVDYASNANLVRDSYQRSRAAGFVPYVADVALDRLRINPGHEPTCQAFGGDR